MNSNVEQEESCDQDQQQPCANAEAIATASQPGDLYTIAHGTSAGSQAIPFLSEGDINDEAGITVNTSDVVMTDCVWAQAEGGTFYLRRNELLKNKANFVPFQSKKNLFLVVIWNRSQ